MRSVKTPDWRCDGHDFAQVYADHSVAAFAVAARISGPTVAADVTQEVFIRLWNNPTRFNPERGSLRAFLVAIARNLATDRLRSEAARGNRERRVGGDRSTPRTAAVDDQLLRDDAAVHVVEALGALPLDTRDAIVTAFYGQLTYRETASVLDEPEGTIKSRIRAGLAQLRREIGTSDGK